MPAADKACRGKVGTKNPYRRDGRNRSLEFPYVKGNKKGADPVQDAPISSVYRRLYTRTTNLTECPPGRGEMRAGLP